eukprot:CAMPEP_0180311630 /NCGR_PEP_ID=MMETSP0988-20121125/30364_1 /TAXON_ID=697907 /ORGANISM="non described non described, Strain CCMP2293" /LENGTH=172 /DNA_ID=CAMNT_0022295747 /DNA_START=186 /DNA_END=705 /DNA_ORIENTATION=+
MVVLGGWAFLMSEVPLCRVLKGVLIVAVFGSGEGDVWSRVRGRLIPQVLIGRPDEDAAEGADESVDCLVLIEASVEVGSVLDILEPERQSEQAPHHERGEEDDVDLLRGLHRGHGVELGGGAAVAHLSVHQVHDREREREAERCSQHRVHGGLEGSREPREPMLLEEEAAEA